MVFKAEKTVDIPTKDLLSWIFDDSRCDPDEPVSYRCFELRVGLQEKKGY